MVTKEFKRYKANKKKNQSKLKKFAKVFGFTCLVGLSSGTILGGLYAYNVILQIPAIEESDIQTSSTSKMFDKNGNLIWRDSEFKRDYIKIEEVPELYKSMLIATEDNEFYESNGYSPKGIANAVYSLIKEKLGYGQARGGSTIEQQLIKNVKFSSDIKDRTIDRKIKEIWLASQLNKNFQKDKILEWYINYINLGENSYGANTISNTYYGISLKDLTDRTPENISKLAIIVGLGQAPSAYNLYENPDAAKVRRDVILKIALDAGLITNNEYELSKQVDITKDLKDRYWQNTELLQTTKEHTAYVTAALDQIKQMGYDLSKTQMQITTNLDPEKDKWLKDTLDNSDEYQDTNQQVAVTVIDNANKKVLAQYGGRNAEALGINRAINRMRSTGSAIKPFLSYGAAIEYFGYGTNVRLDSSKYVYPGTNIVANNYGGYTYGMVDMQYALRMSLNTPTARLLDGVVGSNKAKQFLENQGLDVKDYYGGSDSLGLNLSTYDLANAFSTLSRYGERQDASYIGKIEFGDGSVKMIENQKSQAMQKSTAFILLKMLEGVPKANFTADEAILNYQGYAVKTGTVGYADDGVYRPNYAASDVWIAGTTKNISIAVWCGYDTPNAPNSWINDKYGGHQRIFKKLMQHYNTGLDTSDWEIPENVYASGSGINANYSPKIVNYKPFKDARVLLNGMEFNRTKATEFKNTNAEQLKIPEDWKNDWFDALNDTDKDLFNKFKDNKSVDDLIEDLEKDTLRDAKKQIFDN